MALRGRFAPIVKMFDFSEIDFRFWIPSQVIAFVALLVMIYAMQAKTKTKTLVSIIIFNTLMGSALLILGDWQIAGIHAVAIARDLVFLWREKKYPDNKKISIATLVLFLVASCVVAGFTINWQDSAGWLTLAIFIQLSALGIIFGAWAHGVHLIRLSRLFSASIIMANHFRMQNPTAIVVEIVSITAIFVFYIRYFIKLERSRTATDNGLNTETDTDADIGTSFNTHDNSVSEDPVDNLTQSLTNNLSNLDENNPSS